MGPDHASLFDACAAALRARAPADALDEVCRLLRAGVPTYSWVGVYVVRGRKLDLAAWAGDRATEHTSIPLNTGLCGYAASTGELVNVPDVSKDRRYLACFTETRSELVVPVLWQGTPIGEIDIDATTAAAFGPQDEVFCNRLAAEMAQAVRALQQGAWAPRAR